MQLTLPQSHVAKQLKKFFRLHNISYTEFNNYIIPSDKRPKNFPPLVFQFHPSSHFIKVYDKSNIDYRPKFKCNTVTQLFEKLLKFKFISSTHLKNLI